MRRALLGRLGLFKPAPVSTEAATEEDVSSLDERELALRDAFDKFDSNKDGYIDKEELAQLLMQYLELEQPPTEVQLARIMAKVDLNQNGRIEFHEFKIMMAEKAGDNRYLTIFNTFDKDQDGYITRDELGEVLKEVHPETKEEEVDAIMRSLDQGNEFYQCFLHY